MANNDQTQQPKPIRVHELPTAPQIEAGLRQLVLIAGSVATVLGATKAAGDLDGLLTIVGPLATVVAYVWGQVATRIGAKKQAAMAAMLPDRLAQFK